MVTLRSRLLRGRAVFILLIVALVLLAGAVVLGYREKPAPPPPVEEEGSPWYEDVTAQTGIDFTYHNGEEAGHYAILESLGGGVALIDYDGDGRLDIFVTGGGYFDGPDKKQIRGHPNRLFKNLGNWKFKDVSAEVGLPAEGLVYSHGVTVGDYDCDGWPDLLVTGYGRVILYHNEPDDKGGRKFRDVTQEAGLLDGRHFWSTSAAFGDLDGDGFPDLYLCQYVNWSWQNNPPCNGYTTNVVRDVCPPKQFASVPHRLYHNIPDGKGGRKLRDVTAEAGIRFPPREDLDFGKGLGVLLVDLNGDGKPEIYVANDTTDNFLYVNESTPGHLKFIEKGMDCLVARDGFGTPNGSMGVAVADYDGSGRPSIWVTNYEGEMHALYRNVSEGARWRFTYSTQASGIAAIGQNYVGFGTAFVDVDQDGWEDIAVTNGHVIRHPSRAALKQKPVLLRNGGNGKFSDATARGGGYFRTDHCGRGLAVGDLDNDGRPDIVISHLNEPISVLRHRGTDHHWLGLALACPENRDPIGAKVTIEVGGQKRVRFLSGGGSYLTSADRRILVGLGTADKVERVTVQWPRGDPRVQEYIAPAVDRYWRGLQGRPSLETVEAKRP